MPLPIYGCCTAPVLGCHHCDTWAWWEEGAVLVPIAVDFTPSPPRLPLGTSSRGSCRVAREERSLHPTPCILHPASCTVHSAPCILHPAPCILHPASFILHPTLCTLHPASYSLHPASCTPHSTFCTLHPTPCILQPAPRCIRHPGEPAVSLAVLHSPTSPQRDFGTTCAFR